MSRISQDQKDDEADAQIDRDGRTRDTRILRDWCPCPTPDQCQFVDTICKTCKRREGHYPETDDLSMLAVALEGGLPVARDDLPLHVWAALGMLRGRMHPR